MYWYILEISLFFLYYVYTAIVVFSVVPEPGDINQMKRKSAYYHYYSEFISMVHALNVLVFTVYVILLFGIHLEMEDNYIHKLIMSHSIGYFLLDTTMGFLFQYNDPLMHFHHAVSLTSCTVLWTSGFSGQAFVMTTALGEVTNPPVLLRTALKIAKRTNTMIYPIMEYIFAISFVWIRGPFGVFWVHYLYTFPNVSIHIKVGASLIVFLSFFWIIKIFLLLADRLLIMTVNSSFGPIAEKLVNIFTQSNKGIAKYALPIAFFLLTMGFPVAYYGFVAKTLFHF